MRSDGGRRFRIGAGRKAPDPKSRRASSRSIFLADYGGPIEQADAVRLHPSEQSYPESLVQALDGYGIAIGYQTTALVTAALEGLEVVCKDSRNIMWEPNWLELLTYADWHYKEIESGDAWEHLKHDLDPI